MSRLLDLEQPLIDLKTMAGLLGHMSTSNRTVAGGAEIGEEIAHIQTVLTECHEDLHSWWENALHEAKPDEEHEAEVAALKAELAAVKASHAAPGSEADVEAARVGWWLLTSAALVVISEAKAAGVTPGERAAASEG